MIQPELFSDSHQAFKHFLKVTSMGYFLKSKGLAHARWPWLLYLAAWLATIWIVHFVDPSSIVPVLALLKHISFPISWVLVDFGARQLLLNSWLLAPGFLTPASLTCA